MLLHRQARPTDASSDRLLDSASSCVSPVSSARMRCLAGLFGLQTLTKITCSVCRKSTLSVECGTAFQVLVPMRVSGYVSNA
jgi:hypothetical protein